MILWPPICGRCFIEIIGMLPSSCDNDALKVTHKTQLNFPSGRGMYIVEGKYFEVVLLLFFPHVGHFTMTF